MTVLKIMRLAHGRDLEPPAYQSAGAAGMDLRAAVSAESPLTLAPGTRALVPTGFSIELPRGHEGQVRPRSGLAIKFGISLINTPGTIDADYRGEVLVPLINLGDEKFVIHRAERIAQLVIAPVTRATIVEVAELSATSRDTGGFGSTGV